MVHQRIRKLKEQGILGTAYFKVDTLKLGFETTAYTQIMLEDSKYHRKVGEALRQIPEIVECVNIAGRYALMVKIHTRHNRHLRDVIYERIHTIEGVEGTNTTMVFETVFERSLPI
ncbi:MAG: Lrp/AsnC ligand binding domain-containing protein [Saprospiraceae bacterium]